MKYLIVIEAEGAGRETYHYQPYCMAASVDEARDLMREYMRLPDDAGALTPAYFALYVKRDGAFGMPEYFDPASLELNVIDPTEWLQQTGRI